MNDTLQILIQITIYASVITVAVLTIGRLASGKLSAKVMHFLWLIVLLRLLMPVTFEAPVNIPYPVSAGELISIVRMPEATEHTALTGSTDTKPETALTSETAAASHEPPAAEYESAPERSEGLDIDIIAVVFFVWLCGAVLFLTVNLIRIIAFHRKIAKDISTDIRYEQKLRQAKKLIGIKRCVRIAEAEYVGIPFVCGCFKPIILVPRGFIQSFGEERLSYVLLHELCHVKRRDVLVNCVWLLARALHWFNPLVHIAYKSYLENIEEACDEMASKQLDGSGRCEYAQSMLDAMRLFKAGRPRPLSVSFGLRETSIRKRIIKMMHPGKKSKAVLFAVITAACVMCFVCFTMACEPSPPSDTSSQTGVSAPPVSLNPVPDGTDADTKESLENTGQMTEEDAMRAIRELGLSEVFSIDSVRREDYFGDSLVYFFCNEAENSVSYVFLESDCSLVSFANKAVDVTVPIRLAEDEFKTIASDYAKKIWGYDDIAFISFESRPLEPEGEIYYFGADGVTNETGRIFHISMNGKGEIWGFSSYPQDVDLEKGVSINEAREIGLTLLLKEAHIMDESSLTLISETLSTEYAPMFIFKYQYRSDNPTAVEYDYDCEIKVMAADGRTMGAGIKPITSNLDIIQQDEAEQMAKEYVAEKCYGSKNMWDRLETTSMSTNIFDNEIGYVFFFDYHPKEESDISTSFSYSIMMLATGEFWDIMSGPIAD